MPIIKALVKRRCPETLLWSLPFIHPRQSLALHNKYTMQEYISKTFINIYSSIYKCSILDAQIDLIRKT